MKHTNIDWCPLVPKHWKECLFKHCVDIYNGKDYKDIESSEGIPVIGSGGAFAFCTETMYSGEVIFLGRKGTIDKPLYYDGRFWAVDTMFYSVPKKGICAKYIYYVATCFPFKKISTQTALPSMTQTALRNIRLFIPPIEEQQAIAEYLDKKTSEIDNQISLLEDKQQAYIKLKKSLISEVISHGLDRAIEMKDSGIDWIGEIPAHWELKRIKDVCTVYCGATPKDNANYWDGNITWISPADMPEFGEIEEGARTITEEGYQSCGTSLVPAGSIVISTRAPIGKTNIALKELCTNQGCKCLTSKKLIMRYMLYFIWSKKEQFQALGRGTTFMELSTKDLSIFPLAIPPRQEQQAIADYLDKKTIEIDNQISLIGKKISAYERLKQSLIDEVVTGKRKLN